MTILFRLPEKLRKTIHVKASTDTLPETDPFLDWSAGCFSAQGGQDYVVLVNTRTLYSTLFLANELNSEESFVRTARNAIQAQFLFFALRDIYNERIRPFFDDYCFSKTLDASMTAWVNNLVRDAKALVENDETLDTICYRLNTIIWKRRRDGTTQYVSSDSAIIDLYHSTRS